MMDAILAKNIIQIFINVKKKKKKKNLSIIGMR